MPSTLRRPRANVQKSLALIRLSLPLAIALACALVAAPRALHAESSTNANPLLSIDRIFDSGEFDARRGPQIVWREKGPGYFALESAASGAGGSDLVWRDLESDKAEILIPAHAFIPPGASSPLQIESFQFSRDESKVLLFTNSRRVWRRNTRGDYWVIDVASRELRRLGGSNAAPSSLMFAKLSPDGARAAYVRDNNIHVETLRTGEILALTTNGSPTLINGTFDWVYEEELDLRDGFRWSPDGARIAYWQLDVAGVREFTLINNTAGLYPQLQPIPYPKTGEQNSAARIGVIPSAGGATCWINLPGDPREHYPARMEWAGNSAELLVQQLNRIQNTNRLFLANAETGDAKPILTETDEAWVDPQEISWIEDGRELLWLSERDGWRHVYRVARDGSGVKRVTSGDFDVISLEAIDEARDAIYFIASPTNATQRYLHRAPLSGNGSPERLSPSDAPGTHSYRFSPDARAAIHTYSSFNTPPRVTLVSIPDHKTLRVLEDNKALQEKLEGLTRPTAEFFRVSIGNNVELDGWLIVPPTLDPESRFPVLFHVYGEPAGLTVLDAWGGRTMLWHWMLAQQGYAIASIENRGTPAPRGRAWRKFTHRRLGILSTADQAAGAKALLEERPWLDPDRVGVWGWSGGGSMTLNALFQFPDVYSMGMSVAPVPNMRLYDTIYQERYMGLPADNPEGYRLGSPVTHARNLKGDLLVVHGTGDDNVHYQGVEALVNELIAYNKPFSMMVYPNRSHSISEGPNTRRHLFNLLTRFLHERLPSGPAPRPADSESGPSEEESETVAPSGSSAEN